MSGASKNVKVRLSMLSFWPLSATVFVGGINVMLPLEVVVPNPAPT